MMPEHATHLACTTNSSPELPAADADKAPESEREPEAMLLDEMVEDIPCTD